MLTGHHDNLFFGGSEDKAITNRSEFTAIKN